MNHMLLMIVMAVVVLAVAAGLDQDAMQSTLARAMSNTLLTIGVAALVVAVVVMLVKKKKA